MQDKKPRNEKGQHHGRWERYKPDGSLWYISNYIDGAWHGYFEHHVNRRIT